MKIFLLTHLVRGATLLRFWLPTLQLFLLTHLVRGATVVKKWMFANIVFLLTHLVRGATSDSGRTDEDGRISTHAPRERCDEVNGNE